MRVVFVFLAACEGGTAYVPSPAPDIVADAEQQARLIAVVANAARQHPRWPRIDNMVRAAPIPCEAGDMAGAARRYASAAPRVSDASDGAHARKLFYLRTQQPEVYAGEGEVPIGFVIVKEAFAGVEVEPQRADCNTREGQYCMTRADTVYVDGKQLRAGDATGLFVMAKLAERAGTDEHWIYGTVSAQGTVMAVGRLSSCMTCHEDATHERLFGVN